MNKNTPYSTAIGIKLNILAKNTLKPIRIDINKVETRCSLKINEIIF